MKKLLIGLTLFAAQTSFASTPLPLNKGLVKGFDEGSVCSVNTASNIDQVQMFNQAVQNPDNPEEKRTLYIAPLIGTYSSEDTNLQISYETPISGGALMKVNILDENNEKLDTIIAHSETFAKSEVNAQVGELTITCDNGRSIGE